MIFKFDRYILNADTRTLMCRDEVVTLTPKVFQTLLVLVENHSRVLSKDELFEHIWPHQTVEEANLTQNISILRKALDEAAYGKKYIATFHGHGYRFVEPVVIDVIEPRALTLAKAVPDLPATVAESPAVQVSPPVQSAGQHSGKSPVAWQRWFFLAAGLLLCAIALFYFYMARHQHLQMTSIQPVEVATLTRMEGAQYEPSWSADEKHLAFISSGGGSNRSSVYIQSAGELQPHRTVSGDGEYSSPAWSPDGRSLAFIHMQDDTAEVLIFSTADAVTRRLTTLFPHRYGLNYRHLDWSPDGSLLVVDDKNNEVDPLSLYLVQISDGKKFRLTYPTMDIIGDVAPRFSPDGSRVVFIRIKYQFENDVFVLPASGGEAHKVTEQSHSLGDLDWETNDSLVFSGRLDDEFRFWRQSSLLTSSSPRLASSLGMDMPFQFSISRRSGKTAFSTHAFDLNIWSLDLTKMNPSPADWVPIIKTPEQDFEPTFSPDGSRIAFRSDSSGHVRLWVSNTDGTNATRVDTAAMVPSVYCWERNGQALIFSTISTPGIFEVSLSPQHRLRRITDMQMSHPACSVDGRSVFASHGNFVYRVSIADGSVEKITAEGRAPVRQSIDGRYLFYAQGRMDSTISRLDLATKKQDVIISSVMPGYSDSWLPTSRGIIFIKVVSGQPALCFYDFATSKESVLIQFHGDLPPVGLSGASISPDGKRLLVVRADAVSANIQATHLVSPARNN